MQTVKNFINLYIDKRTVVSVIAAGAVLAVVGYGAKKMGAKSVAEVVKAVK